MTDKESRPAGNGTAKSLVGDFDQHTAVGRQTANDALIARGKAIVDSGVHAPPPTIFTADEQRIWFGRRTNVVDLDEVRRRRARQS